MFSRVRSLRDLEGGDQRSVKRRTSGVKGIALSAGADTSSARSRGGGGRTEPRSRDSNVTGSEIIIKSEARGCASSFQCNETKETASRREEGRSEDHGNSRHDFRGRKRGTRNGNGLGRELTLCANKSARRRVSAAEAASPQTNPTLRAAKQRWGWEAAQK